MTAMENLVSATGEKLLTLDAALALIKREQGREARSLLLRAYACYCARSVTRTDKLLKRALESAQVKLALSTAKRDASIYFELALRGIVREGAIADEYAEYLESITAIWDRLTYAFKIPCNMPADALILAGLAKKSDLAAIVRYNKDSATVQKITVTDCIKGEGDSLVFVMPEPVQEWLQSQRANQGREITSGEIGAAINVLLGAIEHKNEQALEALQLLASRAGYQLVAVATDSIAAEQAEADEQAESELAVVAS
jgi:enamine deaminase RidA (YjgF/YER057c/UK114 family)